MYNLISEDYLMHHGVKGQKWGVRKQVRQAYGYGAGSRYIQRRDIRNLKKKKRSGQITSSQYSSQKQQIKNKAAANRGKRLVEANQTYGKVTAKGVAKTAAFATGSIAASALFAPVVLPVAVGAAGAHAVYQTKNTAGRINDIKAYKRG